MRGHAAPGLVQAYVVVLHLGPLSLFSLLLAVAPIAATRGALDKRPLATFWQCLFWVCMHGCVRANVLRPFTQ